jgi:hypothetical protein
MTRIADVEGFGAGLPDTELVKIIRNRRDEESVRGALEELIRRESPLRSEVFREVLDDPAYSTAARNAVVTALGDQPVPGGQPLLLRHLAAATPPTFAKAVLALGRIGDGEALEVLERIMPPDDATARRALEFARSLLAYRLRIDRPPLALPAGREVVPLEHGVPCQAGNADIESVREALADVKIPGLTLSAQGAARIDCMGVPLLLVFTDDFSSPEQLQTIMERNALPLVMLKKATSLEQYALDGFFFTHPHDGGGARLLGTRPGGDPTYVGEVRPVERGYAFVVRALDSRYAAPIEVEGRYLPGERSWEFTRVVTGARIAAPSDSPRRAPRLTTEPEDPSGGDADGGTGG